MPDVKQAHLQTAQSPHAVQSLQKSLLCPPGKTKNLPSLKNKTLPKRNPTNKKGMKEIVDKQKGMSLDKKEGQLVTGGIFYCRDSGYLSVSASNKLSCNLTGECFEIGNKNIPPKRCMQVGDSAATTERK